VGEEILISHVDKRGWLYKHAQNAGTETFEINMSIPSFLFFLFCFLFLSTSCITTFVFHFPFANLLLIKNTPFFFKKNSITHLLCISYSLDFLLKGGGPQKAWKKRWFVLSNHCLFYYKHPAVRSQQIQIILIENCDDICYHFQYSIPFSFFTKQDKEFRVNIPLEGICVAKASCSSRKYCIILYDLESTHLKSCKRHSNGDLEQGAHEFLLLSAETPEVIFSPKRMKCFCLLFSRMECSGKK
jgi:hypothetical protein